MLHCEKARGIGIYFVFIGISTYEIAETVLSKCSNLKQFFWYGEWPSYLENKLSNCIDLEFVSIKSPSFETYKTLPKLAKKCKKLKYLNLHIRHSYLSSCHWKMDLLGQNLQNLRHLSLSGTHNKYYEASLSKLFKSLQLFTIRLHEIGLGENTLNAIADTQKDLEILSLDDGKSILTSQENSVIHSLSYTIRKVETTKTALFDTGFEDDLRMVLSEGVVDLSDFELNDEVNVEWIPHILQKCKKLKNLTLRLSMLSDLELRYIIYCNQLKCLDLKYNDSMCDDTMAFITATCSQIQNMNLTECKNITDLGISTLTRNCPSLTSLNISFCTQLTDSSLISVSDNSKFMSNLNINYCSNVTYKGISLILQKCKRLKLLYITGCKLTKDEVMSLETLSIGYVKILELRKYNDLIKLSDNQSKSNTNIINNEDSDNENENNEDNEEDGDDFW